MRFLWFVKGRNALWLAYEEGGIYWKHKEVSEQKPRKVREPGHVRLLSVKRSGTLSLKFCL